MKGKYMSIKEWVKKVALGKRYSSKSYVNYLRSIGVKIGKDCTIYVPSKTLIDEQYPWMITIGDHVRITEGVKMLTHDFSWSVLKLYDKIPEKTGAILGASGVIEIGNNVFIGMNTIITRNVKIGDNVIIGAGSVVTKDCLSNGVYVGVPARRIMEISDFYEKRKAAQLEEAKTLAVKYYERFGKIPPEDVFNEYFMLFYVPDGNNFKFKKQLDLCGNNNQSIKYIKEEKRVFNDFKEFLIYCFESKRVKT